LLIVFLASLFIDLGDFTTKVIIIYKYYLFLTL